MYMRTGVEQTRSQKEKAQREESKGDESPPPDAPKPKELERRPVLALALVSFAGCALLHPSAAQRRVLECPSVLARGRVR